LIKRLAALFLLCALPGFCQTNTGELRLTVTDPSGARVKSTVLIISEANQYRTSLSTNDQGELDVLRLPFGIYQIQVNEKGFAAISKTIQIRSSIPVTYTIQLALSSVKESVTVNAGNTLINPDQAGSVNQIGHSAIEDRLSSLPGRSLQDLVNSQPGWLYEGNAVLHPRGSEYQTQFVVDGIPFTNNISPSFGNEVDADDVQSMSIYTAGIPAEYGRKMGGVVVLDTVQNPQQGFHGQVVLSGGSFDSAGSSVQGEYGWGANSLGFSADGSMTGHYLNPVVTQNYSNTGTLGDFSGNFQRDLTPKDRISFLVRHELARYDLPNEIIQQQAGQRQTGDDFDTYGIAVYQHTFSSNAAASVRGMVRQFSDDVNSNPESTPIEVYLHNWFREAYFKSDFTVFRGRQEWKAGIESDNKFLNENFHYVIPNVDTQLAYFDSSTPLTFSYVANRPDLEQGAWVEDLIRLGDWTIDAGLRWDHYQLILNRNAVSPRLAVSRYFPSAGVVLHVSYDRIFQTPSFENLLLSSSTAAAGLDTISLQLPVKPSEGDYYEAGLEKVFFNKIRVDTNYFRRDVNNYADDDQIDNTTISYPIAFEKAIIYGAEGKIELPVWGRFSGYASYSYEVGNAWFPVTGGLFLGDDAIIPTSGHLPDSQDQRNTMRGRLRYQVAPRLWVAGGVQYDTGLPFDFQCPDGETLTQCEAGEAAIYGQDVVDRLNFNRGRILPSFQVDASAGADLYKSDRANVQLQVDGENLTNVIDVIDFGGLFSGNAIGPSRSVFVRLTTNF
jgi:TonB-dependent Receptor Plug Domain